LYLKRRVPRLQAQIRQLIATLVDQADAAGDALMPSYTHMRRAMPVLVAHFMLSHAVALQRDHDRLTVARNEADALSASRASSRTAWTRRLIGTSRRRSSTRAPWQWCI
jgi:argininosuccinate lyase